jgi:hypothetical protein
MSCRTTRHGITHHRGHDPTGRTGQDEVWNKDDNERACRQSSEGDVARDSDQCRKLSRPCAHGNGKEVFRERQGEGEGGETDRGRGRLEEVREDEWGRSLDGGVRVDIKQGSHLVVLVGWTVKLDESIDESLESKEWLRVQRSE